MSKKRSKFMKHSDKDKGQEHRSVTMHKGQRKRDLEVYRRDPWLALL
jgi:hypothetical protein